jgi:hypothetical protein
VATTFSPGLAALELEDCTLAEGDIVDETGGAHEGGDQETRRPVDARQRLERSGIHHLHVILPRNSASARLRSAAER